MGMEFTRKNSVDGDPVVYHLNHHEQDSRSTTIEREREVHSYSARDIDDGPRR
jgi:hypothetical protein